MEYQGIYNGNNRTNSSSFQPIDAFGASNHLINRPTTGSLASAMESTEDVDTSSRPRLTQEQITILEQEFGKLPKPSTEFKKQLADKIGLTLPRVNNWYQNRRAKTKNGAKQAEAQFEVRTDDLQLIWPTFEQAMPGLPSYFDVGNSLMQSHGISDASPAAEQAPNGTGYFGGADFDFQFDTLQNELPEVVPASGPDNMFTDMDFDAELCPPGITIPSTDCKGPMTETIDLGLNGYSPDTPVGFAIPQDLPTAHATQPMYQVVDNGLLVGNVSNQTFISATSSSDGEQPRMMTPPEGPSPISFRPQEAFDRRASITGALANDFQNGFHLQRQSSAQTTLEETLNARKTQLMTSAMQSPTAAPTQWNESHIPPTLNLDTFNENEPAAAPVDLAARRKRPRPAPLVRPDTQRSHSYNGPLTSSPPSARRSLLNPSQPVRRIRSNLDVFSGRIQKPRSSSAQHSPRNVESRFHNAFASDQSARCVSTTFQSPPTPLSAVHGNQNALEYPPYVVDQSNQALGTPTTFDGSFNLNSPPTTPFDISPFSADRSQEAFLGHTFESHQPPQSAPPQKTSFFPGDSPPMQNNSITHLSWQAPHEVPSNHLPEQQTPAVVLQSHYQALPNHYIQPLVPSTVGQHQSYPSPPQQVPSQLENSFSPPQFQPSPEHIYQNSQQFYPQGQSQMTLYQQNMQDVQAQPQQLEIKVELGPQPKGPPQPRKQYTFSNSTPDDYSSKDD